MLARSFARIFFRNAINIGLLVIEVDTQGIDEGDQLRLQLGAGVMQNITKAWDRRMTPLPPVMVAIVRDGGLASHLRQHGGFALAAGAKERR